MTDDLANSRLKQLHGPLPTTENVASAPTIQNKRWVRVKAAIGLLNKHYYDHHITGILRRLYKVSSETALLDLRMAREILARHYGKSHEQVKYDLLAVYDALIQNQHVVVKDKQGNVDPIQSEPPVPWTVRLAALNSKAQIMGVLRSGSNVQVNINTKINLRAKHKTVVELVQKDPVLRERWLEMSRLLPRGGDQ